MVQRDNFPIGNSAAWMMDVPQDVNSQHQDDTETFQFYRVTACNVTHGVAKAFLSVRLTICQTCAL